MSSDEDEHGKNYLKIGVSSNPKSRLASIRTSCPVPINLVFLLKFENRKDALAVESLSHSAMLHCRTSGEWFNEYLCGAQDTVETCAASYWVDRRCIPISWFKKWMVDNGRSHAYVNCLMAANGWRE